MKSTKLQLLRNVEIQPTREIIKEALQEANGTYFRFLNEIESQGIQLEWRYYNDGKAWLGKGLYKWTGSLWRSFLIPLYMVKRPMKNCAILLGVLGIIASITITPIQIMSYTPLVWSVLLFGVFMPFAIVALTNIKNTKCTRTKVSVLIFAAFGIVISPIITWVASVIYEKIDRRRK